MHPKLLLAVSSLLFVFTACQTEAPTTEEADYSNLYGRWELVEALRNGKPTGTLASAYMVFTPEGTLTTNLAGSAEEVAYEVSSDVISQKEGRMPLEYTIEKLTDSSLVLRMQMRDIPFQLSLEKAMPKTESSGSENDSIQ